MRYESQMTKKNRKKKHKNTKQNFQLKGPSLSYFHYFLFGFWILLCKSSQEDITILSIKQLFHEVASYCAVPLHKAVQHFST